jgi:hypothetical protein
MSGSFDEFQCVHSLVDVIDRRRNVPDDEGESVPSQ